MLGFHPIAAQPIAANHGSVYISFTPVVGPTAFDFVVTFRRHARR